MSLDELLLRDKQLTSFPREYIDSHAKTCKKLDITENSITDFSFLSEFSSLNTLILDSNGLKNLVGLPACPTVETLWLNKNRFSDIKQLMDQVSRIFPNLTYLSVMKNPCSPDIYFAEDEGEAYQRFRYYVIARLSRLAWLDADQVDDDERNKAIQYGPLMAASRPEQQNNNDDDDTVQHGYSVKDLVKQAPEPKASTFLVRSKPRYDSSNSEGNRFITNDDL